MNKEWNLDILYKSYESEEFQHDFKALPALIDELSECAKHLDEGTIKDKLVEVLMLNEKLTLAVSRLAYYINLRQTVNTSDAQTVAYGAQLSQMMAATAKPTTAINKFIAGIENLDEVIEQNELLKTYRFMLHEIKQNAKHLLSEEVEEVLSMMDLTGGEAWGNLQEYMTSTLEVDYKGEKVNLSMVRNLAYDESAEVRKAAYEAELAGYEKIKEPVAFALNNIKKQVNTVAKLRGYESPLAMTLEDSRMQRSTLDAMLKAMDKHMPKFRAYMKRKAELLGHENGLPWYDLFAPLGESDRKFTVEEARDYLVNHFRGFADDLADMVAEAFDNAWIDFYPHKGKVGGAFCENLPQFKQSRVLTNFDGALGDVVTLAHELGHAYHGYNIQDHRPLNVNYSMPVAETASTFNENLIMNSVIDETEDKKEKMALIEKQLQDLNQIICDIYSRYLFESAVFENAKDQFMFADSLCEMMIEAQKKAYGDGLDEKTLNPYMWICKSHYYSSGLSFYNFPYAFGGLFARGLYAKYKKEGADFVPKYRELLHATTISSVEDVAAICDIDLTKEEFWEDAMVSCEELIDQFLELSK